MTIDDDVYILPTTLPTGLKWPRALRAAMMLLQSHVPTFQSRMASHFPRSFQHVAFGSSRSFSNSECPGCKPDPGHHSRPFSLFHLKMGLLSAERPHRKPPLRGGRALRAGASRPHMCGAVQVLGCSPRRETGNDLILGSA